MAFDPRFAVVLVGSSGEGGAKLHRRNFGEAVENLTGSGEYHWMAGNFLKYGAEEATFGTQERRRPSRRRSPVDRAVRAAADLHQLRRSRKKATPSGSTSRAASWPPSPRSPSSGCSARGISADRGLHDGEMPPVNEGLLDGQLAWRQHDGGHTDGPTGSTSSRGPTAMLGRTPRARSANASPL